MEYSKLKRKIVVAAGILSLTIAIIATIFIENKLKFVYGIFFGTGISILMFLQMANTLSSAATMAPSQAQKHVTSRYIIRLIIYGVVLFVSLRADYINVLATIIGFLSVKISILFLSIFRKI